MFERVHARRMGDVDLVGLAFSPDRFAERKAQLGERDSDPATRWRQAKKHRI
jgi:hypothetical protein